MNCERSQTQNSSENRNFLTVPTSSSLSSSPTPSSSSSISSLTELQDSFDLQNPDSQPQNDIEKLKCSLLQLKTVSEMEDSDLDWMIERYLKKNAFNFSNCLIDIHETLQWKEDTFLNTQFDQDFSKEFYEISGFDVMETHPESRELVVWITSQYSATGSESMDAYVKHFVHHQLEKLDRQAGKDGVILVIDCKHFNHNSVNLDLCRHTLEAINSHYPHLFRSVFVINLGILWRSLATFVMSWLSKELHDLVKITHYSELKRTLPANFIYNTYGGNRIMKLNIPTQKTFLELDWFLELPVKQQKLIRSALNNIQKN